MGVMLLLKDNQGANFLEWCVKDIYSIRFLIALRIKRNASSHSKYMMWLQRITIPHSLHIPIINKTGGPSFLRNIGITAGESTRPFDIGLIKPLRGRHQSAVSWRDCWKTLRGGPYLSRDSTVLFIPHNKIHFIWKMSDTIRQAGCLRHRFLNGGRGLGRWTDGHNDVQNH